MGKKMVSLLLDEELYKSLKNYSALTGQSMSSIIQTALSLYLFSNAAPNDSGIQDLAKAKLLNLPDPSWDDEELVRWISYRDRYELYNAIRVLINGGGSFRDFAFRLLSLIKQHAISKYHFVLETTRKYIPTIYDYIVGWENGKA
jgi:hypothetical protein